MTATTLHLKKAASTVPLGPATIVDTFFSRARGLQFASRPRALIFVNKTMQRVPLHMFFVFFHLDVLYLDSDLRVVEIKERFRPFAMYFPKERSKYVIELPAGTIAEHGIGIDAQLECDVGPGRQCT